MALAGLLVALVIPITNAFGAGPGTPATVAVTLSPSCIKANHLSTSTATATVKDSNGLPVPGQTVNFATDGDVTFGPVTDHGNGTYTSTITSSFTSDVETISATAGGKTGTAQLTESLPTASSIDLTLNPTSVRAGGTTTSTATATVKDANGKCVSGDTVTFTASPTGPVIGSTTDNGDGTYTASILPSATPGNETITAHDGTLSSPGKTLTQFGPTANIVVTLTPSTIVANGTDTSAAKATLTDSGGRAVNDATVVFSTSGDATVGSTTNNHDGTYSATITASTTADNETITALAEGKSGTAQLTEQAGPPASVTVAVNPTSIPADGVSHSTAMATVKDAHNNPVVGETVTFSTSGDVTFSPQSAVTNASGGVTSTITASTTADTETITATTSNSKSGQATLTETAGPTNGLQLTLSPTSIAADGASHSTATATLKDSNNNPVPGVSVGFGTSGDVTFSPNNATTDSSGVATSQITASTTADTETITANGGGKTDSKPLIEYGKANTVTVDFTPTSTITADGASHTTVRATLKDANGNFVLNETVAFSTSGDVTFGPVTNNGDGTYTSQITASKTADQETITATATNAGKSGTGTLTENPGTPIVSVTLNPSSIVADGASTSTATAAVKDAFGNPYPNESVAFTTTGDVTFGTPVNNHDGTYKVTITSSKTADQETITATDAAKNKAGTATLTETNGPATSVVLGLNPASLTADGSSTSTATATLKDVNNNPVTNETVTMATNGDAKVGTVTNHSDGTYTATITSSKTADTETITATATKANKSGTAQLTENPGPAVLNLTLNPSTMPADGKSTSVATASVKDVNGNPYPSETVTIATDGDTSVGTVTNHNDGTYTATITASKTADQETITATDSAKALTKTATLTETPSGTGFHPLPPTRILDTRSGSPLQPNSQIKVQITGQGGVPTTHVSGVVLNLTATQASLGTYLTVFPSGSPPNSSNLNIPAGRDAANLVTAQLASDGSVQLYNAQGTVHAIFDVVGYYDDGMVAGASHYVGLTPGRILDTRSGSPIGPNTSIKVQVTGQGGVPTTHVKAVAMNLTGTQESTGTYFTVFPSGTPPTASNINLQPSEDRANMVIVPVAADGSVQLYNAAGTAHAILDVAGYFDDSTLTSAQGFTALPPSRILDTRSGGSLGPGGQRAVQVAGVGGVPASGATAVVLNLTATRATNGTFLTVFPQNPRPTVSNINVPPGTDIANLVVATLAPDGTVQLYNDQGTVDAIFDVVGWYGT